MSTLTEKIEAKLVANRAAAAKAIKAAVVAAANGSDKLSAAALDAVADALTALGWSAADLDALAAEYRQYLAMKAAADTRPAREAKADADLKRAKELRDQIEALTKEERELRVPGLAALQGFAYEMQGLNEHVGRARWLYEDGHPPCRPGEPPPKPNEPNRPPTTFMRVPGVW